MRQCCLILNTRRGYSLSPRHYKSVAAAERDAKNSGMAYRIITSDGVIIKRGWKPKN